ncbi:MAG: phosphoglucosamine mutase [Planctomycetia bacterium]|nr:phosphoglucosamine mutase [Planctomycetia bacterium]
MSEPIISVSGLRGIVGDSLTAEVAIRYACALAAELPPGNIVITRDGRSTGPMLSSAICGGLTALGRQVIDAGVAATPTTGVLVRQFRATGGIQISASHNPAQYNGLKLFSVEGRVIPEAFGVRVMDRYRRRKLQRSIQDRMGSVQICADSISQHWSLIEKTVDVDRIRHRQFKVLLDANHGAGSLLGRKLLTELGCTVTLLGAEPDGRFEHTPEPTAENLAGVLSAVPDGGCDAGFCQDPDADRLAVIDESGRYLGEEYTLAICVEQRLRGQRGAIVTNCSTSRMAQDLAEKYNVPFFRAAVGEANVVDAMLMHASVLGGEGNGGVIDPRVGLVRDSFVGMTMILDAMARRKMKVSQLADELPRYEIVKTKLTLPREKIPAALQAVERHFRDGQADRLDGLRLDWPGKWLLIRASNTEPIVRVIAEAPTSAEAQRLCKEAQAAMNAL